MIVSKRNLKELILIICHSITQPKSDLKKKKIVTDSRYLIITISNIVFIIIGTKLPIARYGWRLDK